MFKWILWRVSPTLLSYECLELLDPGLLALNGRLSLKCDPIVRIEFFLELDDRFISLIKSRCESYHNVSLLQQELFVSVDLGLAFLNLVPLTFDLV